MKLYKNILKFCAVALSALTFMGCEEEEYVKPSALLSESSLTFEAIGAEPQSLTIASDDAWFVDVDADWITVDPMSGSNTVDVTVSVTDNVKNGAMDAPREGTLTIANNRGYSIRTVIYQNGDTYLGVEESTVTEAAAFDDGTVAKIRDAQVMAVAKTGFVISDGQTNMYVEGERNVTAGDIVQLSGKCAVKGGISAFVVDGLEVGQNAELRPVEPIVVDGTSTSYPFDKVAYAKVSGTIIGNLLRLPGGVNCKIIDPIESVGATELNVHKVEAFCYYVGTFDGQFAFVLYSLNDKGVDDTVGKPLPYSDDFSWLAPYIEMANSKLAEANKISDCVGAVTSSADGCANIYTTLANNGCDVLGELRSRGYTDLNPGFKTIYLQDAYFKFGKTDCQSGLTLPLFKIDGEQDIVVAFRWCSQMQGSGKIDNTHMVVAIDGPGTVVTAKGTADAKISDPLAHTQKQGQMIWQDAMFTIKGATTATAVTIRSNEFGSPDNVVKSVFRYYLDDIEVMLAADAVAANIKVEGLDNDLITFEGTPSGPVTFNVTSDAAFKVSSSANWLHVENGEGGAGQTNEVTVTCDQSELSVLRKAEITVKSGVSIKKIQVVQSAAGQSLDPFISISTGNYMIADYEESTLKIKVQGNVSFTASTDVEWLVIAPQTKGLVEWSDVPIHVAANPDQVERVGHVIFAAENGLEAVVTVTQKAYVPPAADVIFSDNFSWMAPYVEYYNANSTKKLGRSVEENNANGVAPNAYTDATITASGLMDALAKRGYEDIQPDKQSIYPQDCYWKFGKTNNHTGFKLPVINYTGDATLSFDWSPHMTGSGNIDKVNVVVEIVGSGKVVTSSGLASVSEPFENDWTKGQMGWKTSKVEIKGYSPTDRIIIRPEYLENHDGVTQMRWYLDNIVMNVGGTQVDENLLFEDDFSWLQPYVDAAGEGKVGDTVGKNDKSAAAPNIYGTAEWQTALLDDLVSRGYEDMCPAEKVVYLQPQYLKFGRTGGHNTSIRLPKLNKLTGTSDIELEFDWAAMAQSSGTIDDTKLVVVIEGDGQFGNGTKYSNLLENNQPKDQMFWTSSSVKIIGASSNTRLVIVMYRVLKTDSAENYTGEYNYNVSGAGRFFLDNIKITKAS